MDGRTNGAAMPDPSKSAAWKASSRDRGSPGPRRALPRRARGSEKTDRLQSPPPLRGRGGVGGAGIMPGATFQARSEAGLAAARQPIVQRAEEMPRRDVLLHRHPQEHGDGERHAARAAEPFPYVAAPVSRTGGAVHLAL